MCSSQNTSFQSLPRRAGFHKHSAHKNVQSLPVAAGTQFWRTGLKQSAEKWDSREKLWERPHLWRLNVEWKHCFVGRIHWITWSTKIKFENLAFFFFNFKVWKEVSLTHFYFLTVVKIGFFSPAQSNLHQSFIAFGYFWISWNPDQRNGTY